MGEEEKGNFLFPEESLSTSVVSVDEFSPSETFLDQLLIVFNETPLENRNSLIRLYLDDSESTTIQVEMVSKLVDLYHLLPMSDL